MLWVVFFHTQPITVMITKIINDQFEVKPSNLENLHIKETDVIVMNENAFNALIQFAFKGIKVASHELVKSKIITSVEETETRHHLIEVLEEQLTDLKVAQFVFLQEQVQVNKKTVKPREENIFG